MSTTFCTVDGCLRRAKRDASGLCEGHTKRAQRGTTVAGGLLERTSSRYTPYASPLERLQEAALRLADADAEDEGAYQRAQDALRKAAEAYGRRAISEKVRQALARAKAKGRPVGRPPKVTADQASQMRAATGSNAEAARRLGVSRDTLAKALKRTAGR